VSDGDRMAIFLAFLLLALGLFLNMCKIVELKRAATENVEVSR